MAIQKMRRIVMRITTYTTRIKDNLNVLVKERAFNYKTQTSHINFSYAP